jgi:hypothetical protein
MSTRLPNTSAFLMALNGDRSDLHALVSARLRSSPESNPALPAAEALAWLEQKRPDLLHEAALLGLERLAYCYSEPGAFPKYVSPGALSDATAR